MEWNFFSPESLLSSHDELVGEGLAPVGAAGADGEGLAPDDVAGPDRRWGPIAAGLDGERERED